MKVYRKYFNNLNSHLGKKLSKETRDKLSISHRGQKGYWAGKQRDVNTKIKISKSLIGKKILKGEVFLV